MSLVVWLPLNNSLENLGISSYNITAINTPTYVAGKIGQCYQRANSSTQSTNGINIDNNLVEMLGAQASIAVWVKPLGTHTHYNGTIISSGNWNVNTWTFGVSQDNSQVDILCGGYNKYITCSVPVNEWTHLVSTFNNGTCKLYKNGIYIGEKTGQVAFASDATNTCIGRETYAGGYFGFNGLINDVRIYNHCLSAAEVHEIAQGLVLHYKLDDMKIKTGTNLVTGVTKGGRTTVLTDGRIGVQTTGENADTWFTINLSESITNGTKYFLSCDASGISEGAYWGFPLGTSSNSTLPFKIYNGHNEYSFTANDISWGSNRLFMDDNSRADWANKATFWNFELYKAPALEVEDSSGYGHNGTSNNIITTSTNTPRYNLSSYFGAYNTPNIITENFSSLAPALTNCTITWWGKYDTTKTLLLTGQTTSHYIGASDNNNYYHQGINSSSPVMYKDGVAGTYKCAADGWHFFCLKGVDLSLWTALKINSYSGGWPLNGYISDFRIYCTPLLDKDIKLLYNTSMRVDNSQGIHSFEFDETSTKNQLTKTGILKNNIIEPYITLPDGSYWKLMLFHYVDGGNNLFTSSNATYCDDFGLYSRLRDINNYTYNNSYEFYVIQDGKEFRWTQTSQPTASSITGLTTVSGYNNPVNGLAKPTSLSQTYIGYNAWWGACGCWTSYSTGGKTGIPGFGSHDANGICTTYLALYTRIEKPKAGLANLTNYANNFIEN